MRKLVDIEKIKAEINAKTESYTKRREHSLAINDGNEMYWDGVCACLEAINSLLDDIAEKNRKFKEGDVVLYDGWVTKIIRVYEDGYVNSANGFIPKERESSMSLLEENQIKQLLT